ncbi:MAG: ankyrin repeat domain-containing protein [Armatimonadota bacterium]
MVSDEQIAKIFEAVNRYGVSTIRGILDQNPELLWARDEGQNTLLHHVAARGDEDIIGFLINKGLDVNDRNASGSTALHFAALERYEAVGLLIDAGADVNAINSTGTTPLHYLVAENDGGLDEALLLLRAGADVNIRDANGYTVEDYAIKQKFWEMLALLRAFKSKGHEST